jgi:Heavy metal binding domain
MKAKIILILALAAILGGGATWFVSQRAMPKAPQDSGGRKILYYQSAMHPWIKSDKPGKCPICGMNLVPIYADDANADTNTTSGAIKLNADSISVINVQTDAVKRRPLTRTLHFAGTIQKNSTTAAWFVFDVYERDVPWLKTDQKIRVVLPAAPEKIYEAQIKLHGTESFADRNFDEMSGSTKFRAEISEPPVELGDFGKSLFQNLHAEGHIIASLPDVLTIPRSAVISRGSGPLVYVDQGNGHYAPRAILIGRTGDEFCEILAGLDKGEKVVTTGNVLIDSEAQLSANQ